MVRPGSGIGFPSGSTSSIGPVTLYGPFSVGIICTSAKRYLRGRRWNLTPYRLRSAGRPADDAHGEYQATLVITQRSEASLAAASNQSASIQKRPPLPQPLPHQFSIRNAGLGKRAPEMS